MNTVFQEEQRKSAKGENKMMREGHHHKKVFLIVGYSQYLYQNKAFVPLQISRLLLRFTESISIEFLKKHFIFTVEQKQSSSSAIWPIPPEFQSPLFLTKFNYCKEIRMQVQVIDPSMTLQKKSSSVPFPLYHSLLKTFVHVPFVNLAAVVWSCIPVQTTVQIPPTRVLSPESLLLRHEPGNHCSLISLSFLSAVYSCLWQAFILRGIL